MDATVPPGSVRWYLIMTYSSKYIWCTVNAIRRKLSHHRYDGNPSSRSYGKLLSPLVLPPSSSSARRPQQQPHSLHPHPPRNVSLTPTEVAEEEEVLGMEEEDESDSQRGSSSSSSRENALVGFQRCQRSDKCSKPAGHPGWCNAQRDALARVYCEPAAAQPIPPTQPRYRALGASSSSSHGPLVPPPTSTA